MIVTTAVTLVMFGSLFGRARAALQARANELKMLGEKVGAQARELVNAREAVAETAREARQRATEAEQFRDKVAGLERNLDDVAHERDDLRAEVAAADARVADLSARLARECERAARLEREAAAADAVRLELLSKLQAEAGSRASAVEQLREPAPLPTADADGVALNSTVSSEMDLPPPVTWSSHDTELLDLTPNLEVSESEPQPVVIKTSQIRNEEIPTNPADVTDVVESNNHDVSETVGCDTESNKGDVKDVITSGNESVANDSDSVQTDESYSIEIDVTGTTENVDTDEKGIAPEEEIKDAPTIIHTFVNNENSEDAENGPLCLYRVPWEDSLHPSWTNVDGTACIGRATLLPALHSTSSAVVAFGPKGFITRATSHNSGAA